ncbi:MAG: 4Fe-4S cluster-binding domain-containing protein [Elusimicrobiota bacterium]|jgi:hypothetical protein|nr:4Fe-4S cluster-binding domain-containing protein [Elusimicrobiota bacterium]
MKVFKIEKDHENNTALYFLGIKHTVRKPFLEYLEVHLCDHCNLNCKGCDHFCPIAPEKFTDIDGYVKDLKMLSSKINIGKIRLMGGEPLLHKDVNRFIYETRKFFFNSDLRIVTNGILLPAMKSDFWQCCRECKVTIDMSKYPLVGDKFSQYLDIIDGNGVNIGNIHVANKMMQVLNPNGTSDKEKTYLSCNSRFCANLKDHKLYTCSFCFVGYYNEYFNKKILEPSGIDFYKKKGKEIIKFLRKPIESCRYCSFSSPLIPWEQSTKQEKDWIAIQKNRI